MNYVNGLFWANNHVHVLQSKEKIGNNICVFDQKICWYGDLNFGGNSYKNSSAIRLVNTELAKKITSSKYQI